MSVVMTRGLSTWHLVHRQCAEWMSCAHCVATFHGDSYVCHIQSSVTLILYCCAVCSQSVRQTDSALIALPPPAGGGGLLLFLNLVQKVTVPRNILKFAIHLLHVMVTSYIFKTCPCLFSSLNNTLLNNVHYKIQRAWFVSHSQVILIVHYFYARLHCCPETVCSYEAVLRYLWVCRHCRCLV
jgi:hypothetical protein